VTVPLATRNLMLDALFGRPSYTYSFLPATASAMTVLLYNGDPNDGGTETSGTGYSAHPMTTTSSVYPTSTDGFNKAYAGIEISYLAGSNWGSVSHVVLRFSSQFRWAIPLSAPVVMNAGMYLRVSLPSLLWSAGTAMVGMSDGLRDVLMSSMFGNPFVTNKSLCPDGWGYALWVGNPLTVGVEVSAIDYNRVELGGLVGWPSGGDPYTLSWNSSLLTFPPAQTAWGEVTHLVMVNSNTGLLEHPIRLDTPIDVTPGTLVKFLPNDLVVTLGGPV